jgi:hypothetical protein
MFQNDWMEVGVSYERHRKGHFEPSSPTEDGGAREEPKKSPVYKEVYLDVDVGKKSDRQEWGHVRYQSTYRPDEAFEMVIQWIQATGSIITELVSGSAHIYDEVIDL